MSRQSPFLVRLSLEDWAVLEERSGSRSASHGSVVRARIVLLARTAFRTWISRLGLACA